MLLSRSFCPCKSSLQVPSRPSSKETSTARKSSSPITRQSPPLGTSPINSAPTVSVAFSAHLVPGSVNNHTMTSPFTSMSSPKMSATVAVSGNVSNIPVTSSVINSKTKPPKGLPQPITNSNVPNLASSSSSSSTASTNNSIACNRFVLLYILRYTKELMTF